VVLTNNMAEINDDLIFQMAQTNPEKAFNMAFDKYWKKLYQHAYKKVQSEDSAKDLVQETFLVLWNNFDKILAYDHLLPYLYMVLRNRTLKLFEKDEVRLRHAVKMAAMPENEELSSHQIFIKKELDVIINKEIDLMPTRMKEIYCLQKEECLSIKEIAKKLSISEQTVKNQLQSATKRLKKSIIAYDSSLLFSVFLLLYTI
jgi:RNA polymerase sigma-70 factor (ECF subfamily)